jgi:hypothetical protein
MSSSSDHSDLSFRHPDADLLRFLDLQLRPRPTRLGRAARATQKPSSVRSRVTGRQGRPVQSSSHAALRAAAYPTGVNPSFADGTHSSWYDVTVKKSVSNWLKTPNVVASVRCGPKIS